LADPRPGLLVPLQHECGGHAAAPQSRDIQDSEPSANVDHDFAPRLPCPDMIDRLG
jgi:hypothetical protein